jgi:hypothetical protein
VGRLRFWEVLAAVGSVLLVVALALHWYGGPPRTGWAAVPTLRWFALVTAAFGLALSITQVTSRGAALPVTLDLLAGPVAGLTTILLAIRLITTGAPLEAGAYVGVVAAAATALGAFRALRTEQGWTPGPEHPVELVQLTSGPR